MYGKINFHDKECEQIFMNRYPHLKNPISIGVFIEDKEYEENPKVLIYMDGQWKELGVIDVLGVDSNGKE